MAITDLTDVQFAIFVYLGVIYVIRVIAWQPHVDIKSCAGLVSFYIL